MELSKSNKSVSHSRISSRQLTTSIPRGKNTEKLSEQDQDASTTGINIAVDTDIAAVDAAVVTEEADVITITETNSTTITLADTTIQTTINPTAVTPMDNDERMAAHTIQNPHNEKKCDPGDQLPAGNGMAIVLQDQKSRDRSGVHNSTPNSLLSQQIHHSRCYGDGRHRVHAPKRMDQGDQGLEDQSRTLLEAKTSQEDYWKMAFHTSLCGSQQAHEEKTLQIRRSQDPQVYDIGERLHGTSGHRGRILQQTAATASTEHKILSFRDKNQPGHQGVRVHSDTPRLELIGSHAHYHPEGSSETSPSHGYPTLPSDRRHHHTAPKLSRMPQATCTVREAVDRTRIQVQGREEETPVTIAGMVWSPHSYDERHTHGDTHRQEKEDPKNSRMDSEEEPRRTSDAKNGSWFDWGHTISSNVSPLRDGPHGESHRSSEGGFSQKSPTMGSTVSTQQGGRSRSPIFQDKSGIERQVSREQSNRDTDSHRRFEQWLWWQDSDSTTRMETARADGIIRVLERSRNEQPHQLQRTRRKLESSHGLPESSKKLRSESRPESIPPQLDWGQQDLRSISQAPRRQETNSQRTGIEDTRMGNDFLPSSTIRDNSDLHGRRQDDRDWWRWPIQNGTPRRGDNAQQSNLSNFVQTPRLQTTNRLVCDEIQHPTPTFLQPTPRQDGNRNERHDEVMEPRQLRFPSSQDDHANTTEDPGRQSDNPNDPTTNTLSNVVADDAKFGSIGPNPNQSRQADVQDAESLLAASKAMVKMVLDWDNFVVERIRQSHNLEKNDAKKMAAKLWADSTRPGYKTEWKKFHNWYESLYGTQPTTKLEFVCRAKAYTSRTLTKALEEKNAFYETLNNQISAVSGTIKKTMNVDISGDYMIQSLREKAKTVLLHRKHAKAEQKCTDVTAVLQAIDEYGSNDTMTLKDLRAKVAVLMIIDSAARPSTILNCLFGEESQNLTKFGPESTFRPILTKDQQLAKNKNPREFSITGFEFKKNLCTLSTLQTYKRRIVHMKLVNDIEYAGTEKDAKTGKLVPVKKFGTSYFVKLSEPHGSLALTTLKSEMRKFLAKLLGKGQATANGLRHSVPSIIQFIDDADDSQVAQAFRWGRTKTYQQWYKTNVPLDIQKKMKQDNSSFPNSWKLRHQWIRKEWLPKLYHNYKIVKTAQKSKISSYFTSDS